MAKFCVIGSLNMDLVVNVDRFPRPGETLVGTAFATHPGGKGANQAVALARLEADVRMIGRIGDDGFGESYRRTLTAEGVHDHSVETVAGVPTGIAAIEVDASGENHIVIVAGANGTVDAAFIDAARDQIAECDFALFQLEIPLESTEYALSVAKEVGCATILDPAPAQTLSSALVSHVDYLTPNAHEAEILTGIAVTNEESARRAAEKLVAMGARNAVIKAGSLGAFILSDGAFLAVPGFAVEVVDTTAAGDAFNAGLAWALGLGEPLPQAVRYANAVGALACRAAGAQAAMPTEAAVRAFVEQQSR